MDKQRDARMFPPARRPREVLRPIGKFSRPDFHTVHPYVRPLAAVAAGRAA